MFENEEILEELRKITPGLRGRGFCIVTEHDGQIQIHRREEQPCWGGELRKYKKTHGDDCTRPNDSRPSDLHWPFPAGTPVALSYNIKINDQQKDFFDFILSDESPFLKGFRGEVYIEKIHSSKIGGAYSGFIIKTTVLDPTVLISLINFMTHNGGPYIFWNSLVSGGMSQKEATVCSILIGNKVIPQTKDRISPFYDYYISVKSNPKRIWNQDPVDLTGGTLHDRWDYDRPNIAKIFADPRTPMSFNPFVKQVKDALPEEFPKELFIQTLKEILVENLK